MKLCRRCELKEKVQGYYFCQECIEHKKYFCKCGSSKDINRSYCNPCANLKTKKSNEKLERVYSGPGERKTKNQINNEISVIKQELNDFVEYIRDKGCVDIFDIPLAMELYEKLDEKNVLQGLRDNVRVPTIENMCKSLFKLYDIAKNIKNLTI
jgi:hypothetical protein